MMVLGGLPQAFASYTLNLNDTGVAVSIVDDFAQGVPNGAANQTQVFTDTIPKATFVLSGLNASLIEAPLAASIKERTPGATVSGVRLIISSNGTWIHIDLSFTVLGIVSGPESLRKIDLSWRSFSIADDLRVGSLSFNLIGKAYLADPVSSLNTPSGVPVSQTRLWYLNNFLRSPVTIPADVNRLSLLNFTSLSKPLESWDRSVDYGPLATRLTMKGGFNLTFVGTITEAPEVFRSAFDAIFKPVVVVEVAGLARGVGDFLIVDTGRGFGSAALMLVIVVALPLVGGGAFVFERRILGPSSKRRGKSRNR
jgi:hypothetical protein